MIGRRRVTIPCTLLNPYHTLSSCSIVVWFGHHECTWFEDGLRNKNKSHGILAHLRIMDVVGASRCGTWSCRSCIFFSWPGQGLDSRHLMFGIKE
jgi:hypothetical protein